MIRHLMNNVGKVVPTQYKMGEDLKRGTFVKATGGKIVKAKTFDDSEGVLVRDVVVDVDVAMGLPVSDYSDTQDICKKDENAGIEPVFHGEYFSTTEYDNSLADADVAEDKYLAVTDGKLIKSADATKIMSCGWINEAGHKLLAYKILK